MISRMELLFSQFLGKLLLFHFDYSFLQNDIFFFLIWVDVDFIPVR